MSYCEQMFTNGCRLSNSCCAATPERYTAKHWYLRSGTALCRTRAQGGPQRKGDPCSSSAPYTRPPLSAVLFLGVVGFAPLAAMVLLVRSKRIKGIDRQRARGNGSFVHLSYGGLGAHMDCGAAGYTGSYDRGPRRIPGHVGGACRHHDESRTLGGLAHGGVR